MELLIAICDDNRNMHKLVEEYLKPYFRELRIDIIIHTFLDGTMLLNSDITFDIIILDIEMCNVDGITVKNELFKNHVRSKIIFLTDYENYMPQAFGKNVYGFVKKSNINDLQTLLNIIVKEVVGHRLVIITNYKIDTFYIEYIKADDTYSIFYLENEDDDITLRKSLNDVNKILSDYPQFIRVHRSYIVNLAYVENCKNGHVKLKSGKEIPISRTRIKSVKEKYLEHVRIKITYGE